MPRVVVAYTRNNHRYLRAAYSFACDDSDKLWEQCVANVWCWSLSALITGYTDEAIFPYFYFILFLQNLSVWRHFLWKMYLIFVIGFFFLFFLVYFFFGGEECRNKKGINILKLMRASLFFFLFMDPLSGCTGSNSFLFSERHNWISVKLLVSLFFLKKW